jgi:putative cardiolipin synthase
VASRRLLPLLALGALALPGCTTWQTSAPRPASTSWESPAGTSLGARFAAAESRHPGLSATVLLADSVAALDAHLALADMAERAIDVQYYIFWSDDTGLRLMGRLVAAAERGVRVRILVDDVNLDATDADVAALDLHRNIEIRVFNPFSWRERWSRLPQGLTDVDRLNRRMHGKMFTVDAQVAMLGGRNIGDEYADRSDAMNFSDLEVAVAGPGAREIARGFDAFWNSSLAVPASALPRRPPESADLERVVARLRRRVEALEPVDAAAARQATERAALEPLMHAAGEPAYWGLTHYVQDSPDKARRAARLDSPLVAQVTGLMDDARRELLLESSYLVPGRNLREQLGRLAARGVQVHLLTNSLASTDVAIVHAGYARHRRGLLASGVNLYELRAGGRPRASLHSKAVVVDRERAWIGSFNLDPRSVRLNTENGLRVDNPRFAGELAARVQADIAPERSWQLGFESGCTTPRRCALRWRGRVDGQPVEAAREPEASVLRRAAVRLLRWLPPADAFL